MAKNEYKVGLGTNMKKKPSLFATNALIKLDA
jgi:hypothetical protein